MGADSLNAANPFSGKGSIVQKAGKGALDVFSLTTMKMGPLLTRPGQRLISTQAGVGGVVDKIQDPIGLFSNKEPPATPGINPDEERALKNDARAASFGVESSGSLGGKSREQVERELFEKSVADAITKKEDYAAQQADEELQAQNKVAQIRASREAIVAERSARPGARAQTLRSRRGFLA